MDGLDGRMFRCSEENSNLLAFVSLNKDRKARKNALLLIPGLSQGFMGMEYTVRLSEKLLELDYSVVQANLSSSFQQYGFSSLRKDCSELTELLKSVQRLFNFEKIVLLGHSTGAQDALYYLRYGEMATSVSGVILQGAVSDRDILMTFEDTPRMLEEAERLKAEGKEWALLSEYCEGAPITAERFLSLAGRLTDDDMFSVDLTEGELGPILSPVKVPILLAFSADDQFVLDKVGQELLAERMTAVLKRGTKVECKYFAGDHGLSKPEHYEPFVRSVCEFVHSL